MKKIIPIFILIFFCAGCGNKIEQPNNTTTNQKEIPTEKKEPIVGETCAYKKIAGSCNITFLSKTTASISQASNIDGPGYEGYEIKYKFTPKNPNMLEDKEILKKEHLFLLANSWYPGEKYLQKYNIKENAIFDCELAQISKGTCTPNILSISKINSTDYFETNK